ncbi:protein of unknown function DUF86 [[Leptolyngbya] sp. PCC 7376]|uniref:HepT-like ribonuclease domain-containing protein n=1 Tax=[Leptolyngbya] sp. PCC 7376 TaxID=111781 RepID=UPI00029EEE74|nr:HepT-like ribonuclease domain-containing protein [[Leptolyngbya] sp. PCC 7376]AFY36844.1 protein of unknown function DUF86 [[Leptolyngbya] sp. PCC 7376]
MRNDLERFRDIEEAIAKIEQYAIKGKAEFFENELIQTWVIFQVQIIGEAARSISEETRQKYPQIEWRNIIISEMCLFMNIFGSISKLFGE